MNAIRPIFLATSMTKSYGYFCHIRWNGRRVCPSCFYRKLYVLSSGYLKCKRCRYRFKDFTGTFLEKVKISLDEFAHILYLFVLGVPAYRSRWYIKPKLATVERIFRLIRLAIYDGLVL